MNEEQEQVQTDKVDDGGGDDSAVEEKIPVQPFSFYLKPSVTFKILTTRWGVFTSLSAICYIYELCWTIAGVNNYTDITRKTACGTVKTAKITNVTAAESAASGIYDNPILLITIWHMIEWIRWTAFLTTALVDANLVPLIYGLSLVIPYGFIVCIVVIIGRFSGDQNAVDCVAAQPERARYLSLQIACFFLYFIISIAWIWLYKIKGVDWCHEQYLDDGEDDEDD